MVRTPESAAVDFAESSLFTGRFSILALAACGVGFGLSGRLPAAIFSLAAAAVAAAQGAAVAGDVVVLSPACAAFDRFKNFMERGRVFKDLVNALK